MITYKAMVRVSKNWGIRTMIVWAQIDAHNPHAAMLLLEAQYGRGNVIGMPVLAR